MAAKRSGGQTKSRSTKVEDTEKVGTEASVQPTRSKRPRHGGLGRGLAALIPEAEDEREVLAARPLDVLFPARHDEGGVHERGGSARELLTPRPSRQRSQEETAGAVRGQRKTAPPSRTAEGKTSGVTMPDVSRETPTPTFGDSGGRKAQGASGAGRSGDAAGLVGGQNAGRGTEESARGADAATTGGSDGTGTTTVSGGLVSVPGATFAEIPIDWIIPNTRQPRQVFDEDELAELTASVAQVGVLQPIVVRPIDVEETPSEALRTALEERPEARYELIMGERRLRASEDAGLERIPAIVRRTEDSDLLRDALLENLHRAQLNPLEEASAYQQLMVDFGATQEELSQRIARSRPQIANTLRLLRLPPSVQRKVAAGVISAGHARALLALGTNEEMELLADRIVSEGLSVRTTEELVRLGQARRAPTRRARGSRATSPLGESLVAQLSEAYDTRVTISEGRTKGRIVIEFAGHDDLRRLAGLFEGGLPKD